MKAMFNETMSSTEAMRIFFDYAAAHQGEDISDVKEAYREVSKQIVLREKNEDNDYMTSYHLD